MDRFLVCAFDNPTHVSTLIADGGTPDTKTFTSTNSMGAAVECIGCYTNDAEFFNGTIQHLLVLNRLLTTAERQKLGGRESWANGKTGDNLPAGHPYATRAPLMTDP